MVTEHEEGRLWTLEGCAYSMVQPYACTLHGVTTAIDYRNYAAAICKLVGVLGARVS